MMTLNLDHMDELCQLSYEFKAQLMVIACERMVATGFRRRFARGACGIWVSARRGSRGWGDG